MSAGPLSGTSRSDHEDTGHYAHRSCLAFPLSRGNGTTGDRRLGVLGIDHADDRQLLRGDRRLLDALIGRIAAAVERLRLTEDPGATQLATQTERRATPAREVMRGSVSPGASAILFIRAIAFFVMGWPMTRGSPLSSSFGPNGMRLAHAA